MLNNKPKKILLVDDEKDVLVYLGNILGRAHFDVVTAESGQEAIEAARKSSPDLIILDILIPDISGTGVATILSEGESTKHIPIIFLTGMINKQEEALTKKQGAGSVAGSHRVLAKPVNKKELLAAIDKILFPEREHS